MPGHDTHNSMPLQPSFKTQISELVRKHEDLVTQVNHEHSAAENHIKVLVSDPGTPNNFVLRWKFFRHAYQRTDELEAEMAEIRSEYSDLCQEVPARELVELPILEDRSRHEAVLRGIATLLPYAPRILTIAQAHVANALDKRAELIGLVMHLPKGPARDQKVAALKEWETESEKHSEVMHEIVSAMNVAQEVVVVAGYGEM